MRLLNDSWIISTEVTLRPGEGDSLSEDVQLQVVALPGVALPGDPLSLNDMRQGAILRWGDERRLVLDYFPQQSLQGDVTRVVNEFCFRAYYKELEASRTLGYGWVRASRPLARNTHAALSRTIMSEVRIPEFGSPPKDWKTLAALATGGGTSAGAIIAESFGHPPSATMVLVVASMTLCANIMIPASKVLGRGLEYRIDKLFGTPPRAKDT